MTGLRRVRGVCVAGLVAMLAVSAAVRPVAAQQGDSVRGAEIVARYVEALGGVEAIRSVRMLRTKSVVELPGSLPMEAEAFIEHDRRIIIRTYVNGERVSETGYDGKTGWMTSAITGPMLLEGAALDVFRGQLFLHTALHSSMQRARALGDTVFQGTKTSALIVMDGDTPVTKHFDRATGLLVGQENVAPSPTGEGQVHGVVTFSDYRLFGNMRQPTRTVMRVGSDSIVSRLVEWVPTVEDTSVFRLPPAVAALIAKSRP